MNFKILKDQLVSSGILTNPLYIRYKQYLVPAIVLIIATLITVLVTVPQFLRLFETFKRINDLTEQREFYRTKVAELEQIDQETFQEDLDTALLALPVEKNITGVAGELLAALSGSGMSLDGISFSNSPPESQKVEEFGLKVDVTGTEEQLKNFLERVKLTPRMIKMTSLEVGKARDTRISAGVGFVTLYQQLPSNIGAVDEPVPVISQESLEVLANIKSRALSLPSIDSSSGAGGGNFGKLNPFAP